MSGSINNHVVIALQTIGQKISFDGSGIYTFEMNNPLTTRPPYRRIDEILLASQLKVSIHQALMPLPVHYEITSSIGGVHDKTLTITIVIS